MLRKNKKVNRNSTIGIEEWNISFFLISSKSSFSSQTLFHRERDVPGESARRINRVRELRLNGRRFHRINEKGRKQRARESEKERERERAKKKKGNKEKSVKVKIVILIGRYRDKLHSIVLYSKPFKHINK